MINSNLERINLVVDYIRQGWKLCPIPPGSKAPKALGWNHPEAALKSASDLAAGWGVGLLHAASNSASLDIDDLNQATAMLMERGIDLQALLNAPDAVQIVSGKDNRAKLLYSIPEFIGILVSKKITRKSEAGLNQTIYELRNGTANGLSVQCCVPPTLHPETLREYKWGGNGHWSRLPTIPINLLTMWYSLIEQDQQKIIKVEGATPASWQDVESAISAIPPDCSRDDWRNVGMALQALGHQTNQLDQALSLWDVWSSKSETKYKGQREILTQWHSFKPDGGIGIGSLFHYAKKYGWTRPSYDASGLFSRQSRREALREETRRIGEGDEFDPLPEILTTEQMQDRFIFLSDGSRVFDKEFPMHTLSLSDFRNATAASFTEAQTEVYRSDGKPKMKRLSNADLWVKDKNRMTAVSTTFKPGAELFVSDPNCRQCVNLWSGFRRPNKVGPGDPMIFVDHVRWLFKDRADDFLNWLAHIEQCPGTLPHTAWLHISSCTGTGRNAMSAILARAFPGYTATSLDLVHILESGFNERLSRKVLAIVDEIREGGTGQWRHSESLKQLITAETRTINTKYGRISVEYNGCRFLLFSNHRSAIPLDDTDRRIEVVVCDDKPQNSDYYTKLYNAVDSPSFIAGVAKFLQEREISAFNAGRHAMATSAKAQVIAVSRSVTTENLLEFNESYPFELVTARRIQEAAGTNQFSGDARRVGYAVQEAGWEKLGRQSINGNRVQLYVRRDHHAKWSGKGLDFRKALPKEDGGEIDWVPPVSSS